LLEINKHGFNHGKLKSIALPFLPLLEKSHVVAVKISLVAVIIDTINIIVAVFLSLNFCHYIFVPNDSSSGFIAATTIIVVSP
jgi:hypothetical protein